jgi:lysophospholipid acyltransferase (LPLAT)-like uncharacterized protein
MTLKDRWITFKRKHLGTPIALSAKYLIRLLLWTCRFKVQGLETFVKTASQERCIVVLWHNRLALVAEFFHRHAPQFIYAAFVSKSRDGEPLARLATSYKAGRAIRVPHNARHQALKNAIDHLKFHNEIVLFTPDGPRGPPFQVKPGVVKAAQEAGAAVIPFTWTASRFWQFKTWDQFMLPKPFSTIHVTLGVPVYLNKEMELEKAIEVLKSKMIP